MLFTSRKVNSTTVSSSSVHAHTSSILYSSLSLSLLTVYRPGESGVYWYAVVSGSLEMLDVDPNDSTKTNSICYLTDGDSFGENVIFGTCR